MRPFEIIDHTADIGVVLYGKNLPELFVHAGQAFTDVISELKKIPATLKKRISVKGETHEELLAGFLKELLYLFDTEQLLFAKFTDIRLSDTLFECEAEGIEWDQEKYPFKTALKAVTHHMLKIEKVKDGYRATVIFDV